MRPSSLRDSGIIVIPCRIDPAGVPGRRYIPDADSPELLGTAPKIARASSDRPAPTSPARATISPHLTSSDAPVTPAAVRSRTTNARGESAAGGCLAGYVLPTERPSVAPDTPSPFPSSAGAVRPTFPSPRV